MAQKELKISCIIPTVNRNEYLGQALESVLDQTYPPCEIIIVDNGSEELNFRKPIPPNVKITKTVTKAGASQARNIGATVAAGEYLAFLDDDDYWNIHYLENICSEFEDGVECYINRINRVVEGRVVKQQNPLECLSIDNLLFHNPGINGSNIVIRKDLFLRIGGYDSRLVVGEDVALLVELIVRGHKVKALINNEVYYNRHSDDRLTGSYRLRYYGIHTFIAKYRHLMNSQLYRYNQQKKYKYLYYSNFKSAKYLFYYHKLLYIILSIMTKKSYGPVTLKKNRLYKTIKKIKNLLNMRFNRC